jgi:segregation and condensation protein B
MSENKDTVLPLSAQLEGLLFVAAEPVALPDLAEALGISAGLVEAGLRELDTALKTRGLRLQRHAGRVQLTTTPELADRIETFLGLDSGARLTRAGLETLAIIAYQQPITRPRIDAVRGVNSDSMLKSLLSKGLICELGRAEGPGRPILYGTTPEFLQHLGLNSMDDLPPFELAGADGNHDELLKG